MVALLVAVSTYAMLNIVLYAPPFNWMMVQQKMGAQEASALFANGIGMRPPVEETPHPGATYRG